MSVDLFDREELLSLQDILDIPWEHDEDEGIIRNTIYKILKSLPVEEETVIRLRMAGLTLEEVGKVFDLTRERIRQIEARARRKLKHPSKNLHSLAFPQDDKGEIKWRRRRT